MKLYEYQAKEILRKHNINVPHGVVVTDAETLRKTYGDFGKNRCVIKAQVHAGGRGKGGGIKIAVTPEEVKRYASEMMGSTLITAQTGDKGITVKKILIEDAVAIEKETYLAISIDRSTSAPVIICSTEGGVEIEEVSSKSPEKIAKERVDPVMGLYAFQARKIAKELGMTDGKLMIKASRLISDLYKVFNGNDCSLLEINPLVLTKEGEIVALDVKMDIDDNALFRHQEFLQMRDFSEDDAIEGKATESGLSYIGLDGNIGCLVNGAGLAMATMDIIKCYGGMPANFLDVGGDAPVERVTTAFELIFADQKVKGVLVNIFGGIMKCDIVAEGIIQAVKKVGIHVPLVVRLEGTNVQIAKTILDNSGLDMIVAESMKDAAEKIVKAVQETK
ncbi:MAG: ADP-forming succinate--CoA ligase subunit beta [Candidatus Scalindua sp.]|nr:ADP-forming succinate--CoA ligase subunit beta [Candidatus Scalindua sp.]